MVSLLERNHETGYSTFSADSVSADLSKLPTMTTLGKDSLSGMTCSQGSFCIFTSGEIYTLKGSTNTWIVYE